MNLTRRAFLKGLAATAVGALILPPTLEENADAAKRFWALDSTMVYTQEFDLRQLYDPLQGWQDVMMARHLGLISRETAYGLISLPQPEYPVSLHLHYLKDDAR